MDYGSFFMKIALQACSGRHPAARDGAPDALRALSLEVGAGEQVAVIGPSGAGKTTLLHLLACALAPSGGALALDGRDPWNLPRADLHRLRGQLFLAPQVPPLPPRQRVVTAVLAGRLPHISLWQSLRSLFYPTAIAQADAALARFDLSDKLFERVDRLSGGERQRVGLARALVADSSLLLVDEPLSALDPTRAAQAIASLTQAARERGATLVTTLHHVEMALAHFPRIIGLREGELAFDLPATQVTPERLRALYAQHLDELTGPAPEMVEAPATGSPPVVMHCR
jgi:phosphonate transport system ATP-binding protein